MLFSVGVVVVVVVVIIHHSFENGIPFVILRFLVFSVVQQCRVQHAKESGVVLHPRCSRSMQFTLRCAPSLVHSHVLPCGIFHCNCKDIFNGRKGHCEFVVHCLLSGSNSCSIGFAVHKDEELQRV